MKLARAELDRADVERVLAGDTDAFEGLVERWQGPLINLAWRFCRDRRLAEEWAQEAFLKAFRFLDRWRGEAVFSTWLFALATNVYRSKMRRRRLETVVLDEAPEPRDPDDPESRAAGRESRRSIRRLVAALPPRYRDALTLYYFMEMDVASAAAALGIPEGTLKARLHRARARLESRLRGDGLVPAAETK